jgi:hypothetical protein
MTTTPGEIRCCDDTVTTCGICGKPFRPLGRQRWCSAACRTAAWRRFHHPADSKPAPPVPPPAGRRRDVTVYECASCGERAIGAQRCDDCNTFMRAVGIGAPCPCCDTPIAVAELVESINA